MTISYKPVYVGDAALRDELDRISAAIDALVDLKMEKLHVAPEKPVYGQIAVPDGVNWNPLGSGASVPVWFNGTAWVAL